MLSPRFPTARNVYRDDCRFVVGGTGLEQQRRRPPPAAETGSRGWDRVLIFQSPAKGLRKNQQTQPVQAPAVRFRQGSQRLGMSTGMTAVLWWTVQDENRNKQRRGIPMRAASCLLLILTVYGILDLVQQLGTCRGEAPPSCCARPFGRSNTPLGCLLLRKRELVGARPLHLAAQDRSAA